MLTRTAIAAAFCCSYAAPSSPAAAAVPTQSTREKVTGNVISRSSPAVLRQKAWGQSKWRNDEQQKRIEYENDVKTEVRNGQTERDHSHGGKKETQKEM